MAFRLARRFVTQLKEAKLIVWAVARLCIVAQRINLRFIANRRDLIKRRHLMTRPDITRIHLVVVEIFAGQRTRFIADQTIFRDGRGIELDLHFHIRSNREQNARELIHQHLLRLWQAINITRLTISVLCQRLHRRIVQIAAPKPEH